MVSLKPNDGFVSDVSGGKRGGARGILSVLLVLLVVIGGISALVLIPSDYSASPSAPMGGYRAVNQDFGTGYKNPQVVSAGDFFIVGTIDYGKISINLVNSTTGEINSTFTPVTDGYSWYFRIAVDPVNKALLVAWMNASNLLNVTFLYMDSTGAIVKTTNTTIATGIGTTGFGVAYGDGKFLIVWSDSSNANYGRTVVFNTTDPNSPILGTTFQISTDTHSHANNFVAYDNVSKTFLVLWRNYSGVTGLYNITGKLFDTDMSAVTGDLLVANGVAENTKFDYPSAEGGPGKFFIAYANANSPYQVYGVIMDGSNGLLGEPFQIGTSAQYGVSITGVAYNGTGFVVAWTNESYDIVSMEYDTSGNAAYSQPRAIAASSDSEEWQDVAYNDKTETYYFVWYDYTAKHDYGSLWTKSEYVPEFGALIPILAVVFVAILVRRRH